jgi:hypothetical protein
MSKRKRNINRKFVLDSLKPKRSYTRTRPRNVSKVLKIWRMKKKSEIEKKDKGVKSWARNGQ